MFLIRLNRTLHIILVHILNWLQLVLPVGPISSTSLILKRLFSKIRRFLVIYGGGFLSPASLEKFNKSVIWHVVPRVDEPFSLSANIIIFILLKFLVKRLVLNWGSVNFRIKIFHIGKSHVPTRQLLHFFSILHLFLKILPTPDIVRIIRKLVKTAIFLAIYISDITIFDDSVKGLSIVRKLGSEEFFDGFNSAYLKWLSVLFLLIVPSFAFKEVFLDFLWQLLLLFVIWISIYVVCINVHSLFRLTIF